MHAGQVYDTPAHKTDESDEVREDIEALSFEKWIVCTPYIVDDIARIETIMAFTHTLHVQNFYSQHSSLSLFIHSNPIKPD